MARGNSKCGAGFRLRSGRRLACYNHRVSSGRQPEGAPIWVAVAVAVLVVVIVSAILLPGFIRTYLELAEAERPARHVASAAALGLGMDDLAEIDLRVIEVDELGGSQSGEIFR